VCGVTRPERVEQTIAWATLPIPDALWGELEACGHDTDDPQGLE
jgi:D-threo-aldose 1-dehydrogenase